MDHLAHWERIDRTVRDTQGRDDRAAPEMRRLVIEAHELCVGFFRNRPVDEATSCEVFDNGLSPDPLDAQLRPGNFREDEIVGPKNASGHQRGDGGLESLRPEHLLKRLAALGIERGNLGDRHDGRVALHALHPLFKCGLLPLRLLLRRLSHVVLAAFVVHRPVRGAETRLGAKLLQFCVRRRRDDETEHSARQDLARDAEQPQRRERDEIENHRALGSEGRHRTCQTVGSRLRAPHEIRFRRRQVEEGLARAVAQLLAVHVQRDRCGPVYLAQFRDQLGARLDRVEHGLDVGDRDLLGRRNMERPNDSLIRELQLHPVPDGLEAPRVLAEYVRDLADALLYRALRQQERVAHLFPQQLLRDLVGRGEFLELTAGAVCVLNYEPASRCVALLRVLDRAADRNLIHRRGDVGSRARHQACQVRLVSLDV